mgnify:CR=1 FL=1
MSLKQSLHLARWLGPWAAATGRPEGVCRRTVHVEGPPGDEGFDAWLYWPADGPAVGSYVLAHGFHFNGPLDWRLVRLCHILASAGLAVFVPFLRDFMALRIAPRAIDDFRRAFVTMRQQPEVPPGRPGVFSISVGSLLALRLASDPELHQEVGGALLFGGFADWAESMAFCLTGELPDGRQVRHDPLNQPAIYMNLVDDMEGLAVQEVAALKRAWLRVMQRTWNQARYDHGANLTEVLDDEVRHVPERIRGIFLRGCGAGPEGHAAAMKVLEGGFGDERRYLDPRPWLHRVSCPLYLIHGVDDDVVPVTQQARLVEALPPGARYRAYQTGLFGHTGSEGTALNAAAQELYTMVKMLGALQAAAKDLGDVV